LSETSGGTNRLHGGEENAVFHVISLTIEKAHIWSDSTERAANLVET
jgi:hypothetical protein